MPVPLPTAPFVDSSVTLVALQAQQLVPGAGTRKLTVYLTGSAGFWSFGEAAAVEAAALPVAARAPIVADSYFEIECRGKPVFIESTGGGVLVLVGEP